MILTALQQKLLQHVKSVQKKAFNPFSNFSVGACIHTQGKFFTGCNIENSSFSLTLCAESGAISGMITAGIQQIDDIAVIGSADDICMPCGACRQRIAEFASADTKIHCFNQQGQVKTFSLVELLPHGFVLLKKQAKDKK